MNSKMTANSQLNLIKQKRTKETTRTGTDSQKQKSHGGLSMGWGRENGEKVTGNKKHKWQVPNRGR